jgi:hypothetical protein
MKPHYDYVRLWVASLETQNFNFTAYGTTKDEANLTLQLGLANHAKQYDLDFDWYFADDIICQEVALGHAYRYGTDEPIYTP